MLHYRKLLTLSAFALIAASSQATAQAINFDDLNPSVDFLQVPTPYKGLVWNTSSGLTLLGPLGYVHQDATKPCRSGDNCAINSHLSGIVVRSIVGDAASRFTFTGWLAGSGLLGAPTGASSVRARGYTNGSSIADFTVDIALGGATWVQADFTSHLFNFLLLTPVDANGNEYAFDPFANGAGSILLDDMNVRNTITSTTPEPGSMLLLAAGLAAVGVTVRRRQTRSIA